MDIERCMNEVVVTESTVRSKFSFPADFVGFQGHFPDNKVLPGTCQIQCVVSSLEKSMEMRLLLKQIVNAKFFAPVLPGDTIGCTITTMVDGTGGITGKARMSRGDEKIAEIKLLLMRDDPQ